MMGIFTMSFYETPAHLRLKVLEYFDRTPETMQKDIEAIKDWLKLQPHLPGIASDRIIENFLLLNKCSVEKAKKKLDMYFTIRPLLPEIYAVSNPKTREMQEDIDNSYYVPLPKLTPDLNRVCAVRIATCEPEKFNPYLFFAKTLNIAELRLINDCSVGNVIICDMDNCRLGHLSKFTPALIKKANTLVDRVFTTRLQGMHFIHCPPYIDRFLKIFKSIVKPKLAERIFVHKELESLYEHIPREILPKDLGGDEPSFPELHEIIKNSLKEYQDYFDYLDTLKVDESLRPGDPISDDIFGQFGNFKKLDVD